MSKMKKILLSAGTIAAVFVLSIGLYACGKANKVEKTEPKDDETLAVDEETDKEVGEDYVNIALFGVNSVSAKDKTVDADVAYIASLNTETKEIKLVPIPGNTVLEKGSDVRVKDAYAKGGADQAIALLNKNLDLNIKNYITVNFQAMTEAIDILGGVEIDVAKEEIPHINGYAAEIAKQCGTSAAQLKKEGKQTLNGAQATGYCRIRVTDGGDIKRSSRQNAVIEQMLAKLKDAKFSQMDKLMDAVLPKVETNFSNTELLGYAKDAAAYKMNPLAAFPRKIEEQVRQKEDKKVQFTDYEELVVPSDLKGDVADLHKELFPEK